jgi:uncharacterized protein (TIGR02172 family)
MLSLGNPIAIGRTAEIYTWEGGWILKLFRAGWPIARMEHEAHIARTVHTAGLPVPAVGDVVELHGRLGLLYARVEGPSLLARCRTKPWTLWQSARLLADLHATMHACRVPALPSQRQQLTQRLREAAGLPSTLREAALQVLHTLPDADRVCHGDFHPDNVLLTAQGPIIIDWPNATRGNPMADVAQSSVLLRVGVSPSGLTGHWWLRENGNSLPPGNGWLPRHGCGTTFPGSMPGYWRCSKPESLGLHESRPGKSRRWPTLKT